MFSKLTNKILGKKVSQKAGPYSDIPIFENVDSIGLPGLNTVNLANEPSLQESPRLSDENKTPLKSFPRSSMTTRSGQKRARDALLGDKENVPRLPGANNILDEDRHHQNGKVEKNRQYYDEKHADSDEEASVTVESVDEESDEDERDEETRDSPVKRSRMGDDRFHTERPMSTKGGAVHARGKKVGFKVQEEEPQHDSDDDIMDYEEHEEYDEMEREQVFSKVRHGHQEWVKQYVNSKNSDLGKCPSWSVDEKGNTLLHVAVQNNQKKMASILIKLGADVNKTNKKGMTCLDYAEMYHFNKLAEFLMGMDALNGVK